MMKWLSLAFLRVTGWKAEGDKPTAKKYVLIAAPHTTNWDFFYVLAFARLYDIKISWIGKHTLFRWPFGGLMRRLGGVSVRRHERANVVADMARAFARAESLTLIVPAEGTRSWVPYWKSGFYHIANTARVPIVMGYLDYKRKRGGFGPAIMPTGNLRYDMDRIRAFYADKIGKYPAHTGEVRLREEESPAPAPVIRVEEEEITLP
jgi:1-acyl-sn-glycerol-3-phosphate acyltransferase